MSWVGASVFMGLLVVGFMTLPWGLLVLAALAWLMWDNMR